jgi:adenylylsulfate kinase
MNEPRKRAGAGSVVWLTGLPASGKTTLASAIHAELAALGAPTCTLDGDAVRLALVPSPGYSPRERDAFYATLGRLAALLAAQGLTVLVAATAHRAAYRADARAWAPRFFEVHVHATLDECRQRDPKGLYSAASSDLPGVDVAYEAPESPEIVAQGGHDRAAVARVIDLLQRAWERDR